MRAWLTRTSGLRFWTNSIIGHETTQTQGNQISPNPNFTMQDAIFEWYILLPVVPEWPCLCLTPSQLLVNDPQRIDWYFGFVVVSSFFFFQNDEIVIVPLWTWAYSMLLSFKFLVSGISIFLFMLSRMPSNFSFLHFSFSILQPPNRKSLHETIQSTLFLTRSWPLTSNLIKYQ